MPHFSLCPHHHTSSTITRGAGGGTPFFRTLSLLGSHRSLDYLSRLALTSVAFTDGGFMSRHLVQLWGSPSVKTAGSATCSPGLLLHMHAVMRALFRSRPRALAAWGVDVLLTQLNTLTQKELYGAGGLAGASAAAPTAADKDKDKARDAAAAGLASLLGLLLEMVQDPKYLRAVARRLTPKSVRLLVSPIYRPI